jgi:hypothetical protein
MFRKIALAVFATGVGMVAATALSSGRHATMCGLCDPHEDRQPSRPADGQQDRRDHQPVNVRTDHGKLFE